MLLEAALVELRVIEGIEVRRQSPEHPDEPELPGDAVAGETEPHFAREFEPVLRLPLDPPRQPLRPGRVGQAVRELRKIFSR